MFDRHIDRSARPLPAETVPRALPVLRSPHVIRHRSESLGVRRSLHGIRIARPDMGSDGNPNSISREELYELVWKAAMRHLAKGIGLTDVGLAKLCRRHDIPTPTVGYWAKLAHGKQVLRPNRNRRAARWSGRDSSLRVLCTSRSITARPSGRFSVGHV